MGKGMLLQKLSLEREQQLKKNTPMAITSQGKNWRQFDDIGGQTFGQKFAITCHHHNRRFCKHNCMNGFYNDKVLNPKYSRGITASCTFQKTRTHKSHWLGQYFRPLDYDSKLRERLHREPVSARASWR